MKLTALLLFFLCLAPASLGARTVVLPNEPISLDIPDDWRDVSPPPGMLYCAAGGPYIVQVVKAPNPRNVELDAGVVDRLKNAVTGMLGRHGGTVVFGEEGPLTMGGAPAYLIHASESGGSTTAEIALYVVDANQALYMLSLITTGSMPDPKLQGIADSFAFTSPPRLPESTFARRAFKLGIIAVGLLVLGGVVGGAFLALRRR